MTDQRIPIAEEIGRKRTFVWAIDWPGWCRAGRDAEVASAAVAAVAEQFAPVAALAGLRFPTLDTEAPFDVVESVAGDATTDFGAPSIATASDRRPMDVDEAERLAGLVAAAWTTLDRVAAAAPATLRKGPRGGGRDRDAMLEHVIAADHAYAGKVGVRMPTGSLKDRAAVDRERAAILRALRAPSAGEPLRAGGWLPRYAARRIAWHALDHAWEIEDRADPTGP